MMSPINPCHHFNNTHWDQIKGFCTNYWGNININEAQWRRRTKKACFGITLRQDAPNVGPIKDLLHMLEGVGGTYGSDVWLQMTGEIFGNHWDVQLVSFPWRFSLHKTRARIPRELMTSSSVMRLRCRPHFLSASARTRSSSPAILPGHVSPANEQE